MPAPHHSVFLQAGCPSCRPTNSVKALKGFVIPDKAKVNGKLYCEILLPRLIEDCKSLLPSRFIFQQDGAPAHTAMLAQNWVATNCSDFIGKDEWPPNSSDFNPLDYHVWGAILEQYKTPKPNTIDELKKVLQTIWDDLPQINKAILSFVKRLRACVKAWSGHFGRLEINCFCRVLNC